MSISSVGGNSSMMMAQAMRRPDPSQMADKLFAKLDSAGQGYIQKADLQAALDKTASATTTATTGSGTANVDDLFAQLDTNSDGKVTKQEFSDVLKNLSEQLDKQAMSMRMNGTMPGGGMGGGMSGMGMPPGPPPGPPPGGNDEGMSKDQLSSMASSSSSDSSLSNLLNNFDKADTNGDGKVSFKEAMDYQKTSDSSSSTGSTGATDSSSAATAGSNDGSAKLMMQIMRLAQAYNLGPEQNASSLISVSA